jgi:hypothetical protein
MTSQRNAAEPPQKLVLKRADLRKNAITLFDSIDRDEKLKSRFIEDPVGILSEHVFHSKLPRQQASEANRLLFAILQNDAFVNWLGAYSVKNRGRKVPKQEFAQDFARAVIEHGDHIVLTTLLRNAIAGFRIPGIDVAEQGIINNAAGAVTVTSVNQRSTSDQSARSSQNFNGVGFGFDVVSAVAMRTLLEQLIGRAKRLAAQGELTRGRL